MDYFPSPHCIEKLPWICNRFEQIFGKQLCTICPKDTLGRTEDVCEQSIQTTLTITTTCCKQDYLQAYRGTQEIEKPLPISFSGLSKTKFPFLTLSTLEVQEQCAVRSMRGKCEKRGCLALGNLHLGLAQRKGKKRGKKAV